MSYFELGSNIGNGDYVLQNITLSQTIHDEAVFTSIGVDGTEMTETVELNIREGDNEIELTADLPNVTIDTGGLRSLPLWLLQKKPALRTSE